MENAVRELILRPIGTIRTPYRDRYSAPSQPGLDTRNAEGKVILQSGQNFEQALHDLDGFEKIWLIYWFDRNSNWKPKVQVPRGPRVKRGIFATRSPHRPNPIGLSLVTLLGIKGRTLFVDGVDILDKTPLLDIKPYLSSVESFPNARIGWLSEIATAAYEVIWNPEVLHIAEAIESENTVDLIGHAERILSQDPWPHPYRRIKRNDDGSFTVAMKYWRIIYTIDDNTVVINSIRSELPSAFSV